MPGRRKSTGWSTKARCMSHPGDREGSVSSKRCFGEEGWSCQWVVFRVGAKAEEKGAKARVRD